ncbi:MAG: enoyl-CoA hydratase/isomerase family protein [Gammaproteobacteria bacterium]|nr:enoyl-CoA hydratase/isomerase family protein [Gammaproteobacteria bacterium]
MISTQEIITYTTNNIGIINLNRPKALNALNHTMILAMYNILLQWQNDPNVLAVLIRGNCERAFCSGGDIRSLYLNGRTTPLDCMQFFQDEYNLNTLIKNYTKPYIALLHGITMGGGIGVSIHGSHKVAATNLVFAMPETGIGFFPDVGGSYFLSRCPDYTGIYLGLTGNKINCFEAKSINLIDNIISDQDYNKIFDKIITELANFDFDINNNIYKQITSIINNHCNTTEESNNQAINNNLNIIKNTFKYNTLTEIITALEKYSSNSDFAQKTLEILKQKSPTSLVLTLELLNRGKNLDFKNCMKMEYGLAYGFLQHNDLYEGIRAAIIDKDNNPKWDKVDIFHTNNFKYQEHFISSMAEKLFT